MMGKQIVITPIVSKELTLEERLADFNPDVHRGEVMPVSEVVGVEQW